MKTLRDLHHVAQALALFAALFGGLGYGTGNILQLALDPEGAARAHGLMAHHASEDHFAMHCGDGAEHAAETVHAHARPPLQLLPAHCFFCLDGIAPQPVELAVGEAPAALRPIRPATPRTLAAPGARRPVSDPARGPPALV